MNPTLQHLKFIGKMGNQLGQLKYPSGLCIQPFTRHLLVCDAANHRIQVVSLDEEKNDEEKNDEDNEEEKCQSLFVIGRADGKPGEAKGEFNHPSGISCGMDGSMVVADSKNHRVQIFDASGRFLSAFGSKRERPAELNWPHDVCFILFTLLVSPLGSRQQQPTIVYLERSIFLLLIILNSTPPTP